MVEPPQKSYFPVAAHSIQCAFYFSHGSFSSDFRISQTVLFNSDILRIFTISGITIMTQIIGYATITPVYPRSGTNVTAITTFPIISSALEVNGITISPSPCIAFLSTLITAVTK